MTVTVTCFGTLDRRRQSIADAADDNDDDNKEA